MALRRLLHYEILSELGFGGMGVVYLARDSKLGRQVAIKVLAKERLSDAVRRSRFVQEARVASSLNHPHIVTIHEINRDQNMDFIVMEYVPGKTLDRLIQKRGLATNTVLKYGIQISDALAKAHAAGILHRDLKPSNIIVSDDDSAKVLDFGLAKLMDSAEVTPEETTRTALAETEEGTIVGTIAYMSPEQAEGRPLDGRSDVFSFGAVLYEMITGQRAFAAGSKASTLAKILREDPRPASQIAESIPPDLEKMVNRCLRKDPARRFQHMSDVKAALEDLKQETSSSGQKVTPVPAPRYWRTAALVLLVVGLAGAAYWRTQSESGTPETAISAVRPLTSYPGTEAFPTLSPEGNQLAFVWDGAPSDSNNEDVYVQVIGSPGNPLRLTTDPARDVDPVWSPDGRSVAFRRQLPSGGWSVRLIPPLGGVEVPVTELPVFGDSIIAGTQPYNVKMLEWSADAHWLVVTDQPGEKTSAGLFAIAVPGGEKRPITQPSPPAASDSVPALSPDGTMLAFIRCYGYLTTEVWVIPVDPSLRPTGPARMLAGREAYARALAWAPDGKSIVIGGVTETRRAFLSGRVVRIPFGTEVKHLAISKSSGGRGARLVLATSVSDSNIYEIRFPAPGRPAAEPAKLFPASSSRSDYGVHFSPDGKRVVFSSTRTGFQELWVANADGSGASQLTFLESPASGSPHWSPDGASIVFDSVSGGKNDIWLISAAGGKPRRLSADDFENKVPSFSADGRWVLYNSNRSGRSEIWRMPVAGGQASQLTRNGAYLGLASPDGASIYFVSRGRGFQPLYRIPAEGGVAERVAEVAGRAFCPTRLGIYFLGRKRGSPSGVSLHYVAYQGLSPVEVATFSKSIGPNLAASPDGLSVHFNQSDASVADLVLVEDFR